MREALSIDRKLLEKDHPRLVASLNNLAALLQAQRKPAEAEPLLAEALNISRQKLGDTHPTTVITLNSLGSVLLSQDKLAEAEQVFGDGYKSAVKGGSKENRDASIALTSYVYVLLRQKKFAEAESPARESVKNLEMLWPDFWRTFYAQNLLGSSLLGQNKFDEAERFLFSGFTGMDLRKHQIPAESRSALRTALRHCVKFFEVTGQAEKASEWKQKLADLDQAAAAQKSAVESKKAK